MCAGLTMAKSTARPADMYSKNCFSSPSELLLCMTKFTGRP
jgi:hypothetical protein